MTTLTLLVKNIITKFTSSPGAMGERHAMNAYFRYMGLHVSEDVHIHFILLQHSSNE